MCIVVIMQSQPDLLHIILALRPPRSFAGHLYGGKQYRNQQPDDCDRDEQLNQREST
jgi:hypothetical protein